MAESLSTPRITAPYLSNFTNQNVRVVGRVAQLRGEHATIDAEGEITLRLNRDSHLTPNNAVEIVGRVNTDLSLTVLLATDFGANIDYKAFHAVVDATHRHRDIFYESG
ncbi:MAG: hypothetical protein M1833_003772 [Piccolia ochrophora]|nr:MAG: hypothetical protein M1833_003772 [Piccolia ochrophora]